jgi:proton-dependent oligopeptide transporter, POT family
MANPYDAPQTPLRDSIPDQQTWLGHPLGLFILFVVEMWERFSYYGMRALLVLYLYTNSALVPNEDGLINPGRGWTKGEANILYGWYTGLAYLVPIFGGLIADRLAGNKRSMILGGVIISLGHVVLAISGLGEWGSNALGMSLFIWGLGLIVIGTGHFKPCVTSMVGQLYGERDPRRDAGFTIFYMGINLGAFLGTLGCAYLGEKIDWHWGFGAAAVGMLLGLGIYLLTQRRFLGHIGEAPAGKGPAATLIWFPVALALSGLVAWMFHQGIFDQWETWLTGMRDQYPAFSAIVSGSMIGLMVIAATAFTLSQKPEDRGPVTSIFILMVFNAFFWLAFEQAGSSINIFTKEKVDRHFMGSEIPASAFQSINPFIILLLGPVMGWLWTTLSRRNMNPSQGIKVTLGLALLGSGFLLLVFPAMNLAGGAKVAMIWIVGMYLLHTIGELFISPTGLSYVTKTAPVRFLSLLTGIWFISNFLANLVGGLIAAQVEAIEKGEITLPWQLGGQADFFMLFVVSSSGAALAALLLAPLLKRLVRGKHA